MKKLICILAATALLCGCIAVHTGPNFDTNKVSLIKKGETKEPDLVALFGHPNLRTTSSQTGNSLTWSYSEGQAGIGGARSSNKTLTVWLDQSGITTNYTLTTGAFSSNPDPVTNHPAASMRK